MKRLSLFRAKSSVPPSTGSCLPRTPSRTISFHHRLRPHPSLFVVLCLKLRKTTQKSFIIINSLSLLNDNKVLSKKKRSSSSSSSSSCSVSTKTTRVQCATTTKPRPREYYRVCFRLSFFFEQQQQQQQQKRKP
jgi:hypothetical protein